VSENMGWNLYSTLRRPPPEEAVKISVPS